MGLLDRILVNRELEAEVLNLRSEIRRLKQQDGRSSSPPTTTQYEPLLLAIRALRDARSIDDFADVALQIALDIVHAERGAILVAEPADLISVLAARTRAERLDPREFVFSRTIASAAAREGQVVASGGPGEDAYRVAESVKKYAIESVLCLPLRRAAKPAGCLYVEAPEGNRAFARAHPPLVIAFSDMVSLALERLETEAQTVRRTRLEGVGLAAASIAHDVASPLCTAELGLKRIAASDPPSVEAIGVVSRAVARARDTASALLWYASGRDKKLTVVPSDLGALVAQHLVEVGPELALAKIEPVVRAGFEGSVLADPTALLRVLANLASNARQAMPDGGPLVYRSGESEDKKRAWLEFEDTGRGIPPERLANLFRPFETHGEHAGTGLGLVVASELVHGMGGTISASSEVGVGSRFRIELSRPQ